MLLYLYNIKRVLFASGKHSFQGYRVEGHSYRGKSTARKSPGSLSSACGRPFLTEKETNCLREGKFSLHFHPVLLQWDHSGRKSRGHAFGE